MLAKSLPPGNYLSQIALNSTATTNPDSKFIL
jgi:hypothetical protein